MKKYFRILFMMLIVTISLWSFGIRAESGGISLTKEATKTDQIYGRDANVKLTVEAKEFNVTNKTDVVLVIDRSSSMNDKASKQDKLTKIGATKKAAKNLVDNLLSDNNENIRIGIVVFGSDLLSSLKLTSNIDEINNFIENIENSVKKQGTNIQIGLKQANEMLDTDNSKYVILLTDGEATYYTDELGIRHGTGQSDLYECTDWNFFGKCIENDGPKPSEKALVEANKIKEKATLLTVGFNAPTGQEFLTEAATLNGSFTAQNEAELFKKFEDISKDITLIATDVEITDIVPATFIPNIDLLQKTYGDNISINNVDGKTVIKLKIGDLYSTDNPTLEYSVEAVLPHYGNMYTNEIATLTGKATDGNPFYVSTNGKINIEFPLPEVDIPSVTKDDDYGKVYQGEKLNISLENSILKNDYLTKNEDVYKVSDQIVIENLSNLTLEELKLNDDGTFNYTAPTAFTGVVSFDYYVKSTIIKNSTKSEVISNKSTVSFEVIKKQTNYVVNYLEKNTNNELHKAKVKDGYIYENITEKAIDILGYSKVEPSEIELKLKEKDNIINFYYEKIEPTINNSIDKNGTDKIETKNSEVDYEINYETSIDNYIGNGKILVIDELPYEIDVTKSDLNGGIYNEVDRTIVWEIVLDDINTYQDGIKNIKFNKEIKLVFIGITGLTRDIENNVSAKLELTDANVDLIKDKHLTKVEIKSSVVAKYQDELGKEIAKEETKTDLVGIPYKTNAKEIEGYKLIEVIGDEEDVLIESEITVVYKYQKLEPIVKQKINKTGTDKITSIDDVVNYNINYVGSVEQFKGNLKLIIIDYLPYEIDVTKSNLNGGLYNELDKTISWEVNLNDINTYQNDTLPIIFEKGIDLVYKNVDPTIKKLKNTVEVKIEGIQIDEIKTFYETDVLIPSNVITMFVDEYGNELEKSITETGICGDNYQTEAKKIDNYHLIKIDGKETGKFNLNDTVVKYIYSLDKGIVTIRYVDEAGKELIPSVIKNDYIGNDYKSLSEKIDGYKLLKVEGNENGKFSKDEIVVTYIYEKIKDVPFTQVITSGFSIWGIVLSTLSLGLLFIFRKRFLKS